jgi:hypothetical protein
MNTDGSEKMKICDDSCYYLNVSGDYIFYSNHTDGNRLYRINKDGTGKTALNRDDTSYINVVDDWVYYKNRKDKNRIYKVRSDGSHWQRME